MKRGSSPTFEDDSNPGSPIQAGTSGDPPPSPLPKAKGTKASPTKKTKITSKTKGPTTPKGKLLAFMMVEAKKMDRVEAERLTGLKPGQQREMMRDDGKGALYNALMKLAEEL